MKKLLTLMIMLGLFAMPSITTQAYTLDANDIPLTILNGFTLNEIFKDSNSLTNGNFDNGTTNWTTTNASQSVTDGINTFLVTTQNGRINNNFSRVNGIQYYFVTKYKTDSNLVGTHVGGIFLPSFGWSAHSGSGNFEITSFKGTGTTATVSYGIMDTRTSGFNNIEVDFFYIYNLNNLGIDTLSISTLNYYFNLWLINNAYIEGFTNGEQSTTAYANGYTDGFGDGYLEGVSEDNAYALGYARGLTEGADMETGSSILIFVVAAIGFIMMIFGFTTKRGIFNLLSVGAFVVLGAMLSAYIGFIIIAIGLVLINVYYAFWGDL